MAVLTITAVDHNSKRGRFKGQGHQAPGRRRCRPAVVAGARAAAPLEPPSVSVGALLGLWALAGRVRPVLLIVGVVRVREADPVGLVSDAVPADHALLVLGLIWAPGW